MSNYDDQHLEILEAFLVSENKFETLLSFYISQDNVKPPTYYKVLFAIFTSYVTGEYDDDDDQNSLSDYLKDCFSVLSNGVDFDSNSTFENNSVDNFLNHWGNYLSTTMTDNETYGLLIKHLSTIYLLHTELKVLTGENSNYKQFAKIMTTQIWKIKVFRNMIKLAPMFESGKDYETNGLFQSFGKLYVDDVGPVDENINSVTSLINDEECHEHLITYIDGILTANAPYTYDDPRFILTKKCNLVDYNVFVLQMLIRLIKYYDLDVITNSILNDGEKYKRLYMTILKCIPISHIAVIKKYFLAKADLIDIERIPNHKKVPSLVHKRKLLISDIKKIISFLDTQTNDFVQDIYKSFSKIAHKIKCDDFYSDFVIYFDYITSFTNTEIVYNSPHLELFNFLSKIVGNMENQQINVHIRYYACTIILRLTKTEGFGVFENLFENLFKYISEVKFFDWTRPDTAIKHQNKLVETICMLTDCYTNELSASRDITAGTLYVLLKKSVEIFENIHQACELIKSKGLMVSNNTSYFAEMVNVITVTLKIHQNVYDKNIIKTIYPEVENEYVILVNELLNAVINSNHEFYTVLQRPDLAGELLRNTLFSVNSHINFCSEYLLKTKDVIIEAINRFGSRLQENEKKNIIQLLSVETKELDYPPEFLDPLLNTPINDPVKIPGVNNYIFDKIGIVTHIHNSKENPYTRKPLTIKELEEYNNREEIINEINDFKEKKKKFEEEYN